MIITLGVIYTSIPCVFYSANLPFLDKCKSEDRYIIHSGYSPQHLDEDISNDTGAWRVLPRDEIFIPPAHNSLGPEKCVGLPVDALILLDRVL